jgi:hypothetical protein
MLGLEANSNYRYFSKLKKCFRIFFWHLRIFSFLRKLQITAPYPPKYYDIFSNKILSEESRVSTASFLVLELQSSFLEGALRALQRFRQADFSCIRPYCPAKICERKDDISDRHTFVAVGIDIVPLAVLGQRDDNNPT